MPHAAAMADPRDVQTPCHGAKRPSRAAIPPHSRVARMPRALRGAGESCIIRTMRKKRTIRAPTTGTPDFKTLITSKDGKYVDKTALLYELATPTTDAQLFVSRPRRFGKSLMLSTLKAMFEGRRDLFKGLAIDKLPWEGWKRPHPVYSFTMASAVGETYDDVRERLGELVSGLCREAGVPYNAKGPVSGRVRVRVQVPQEREGGDPADPRARLCGQVGRRPAPRDARRNQLQPEEAQHRHAGRRAALTHCRIASHASADTVQIDK